MRNIRVLIIATILALAVIPFVMPESAHALSHVYGSVASGADAARGDDQPGDLFGQAGVFKQITNIMLFIVGAVSVIMIIIGGLRYVISGGDSTNITAAKNTILYAIVGIVVSLLAYAAVNFIIGSFAEGGGYSSGGSAVGF